MRLALLVAALLSWGEAVVAEPVTVRSGDVATGQGWVFRRPDGCFAAVPRHVIAHAGSLVEPALLARDGRTGHGLEPIVPDAVLDLAILRVIGALTDPCGRAANLGLDSLDHLLAREEEMRLEFGGRGEFVTLPVSVARTSSVYVALRPTNPADRLKQSMSGATLLDAKGTPVGMVLRVWPEKNRGRALRFDVIKALAKAHARGNRTAAKGERGAWAIGSWTGRTLDPAHGPQRLLDGGYWLVEGRSAELVLESGEPVRVVRISVAPTPPGTAAGRPGSLAIYTRAKPQGSWIFARSCNAMQPAAALAFDCSISPRRVRQLKLAFSTRGGDGTLAIGSVSTSER